METDLLEWLIRSDVSIIYRVLRTTYGGLFRGFPFQYTHDGTMSNDLDSFGVCLGKKKHHMEILLTMQMMVA